MPDLASYEVNDPTFEIDVRRSYYPSLFIAKFLYSMGKRDIRVPPIIVRPSVELMREYSDGGDIFVGSTRIEAKKRGLHFTAYWDFPFREKTIIVDATHCYDGAVEHGQRPASYFLMNKGGTHCFGVPTSTHPTWTKEERWDHDKKRDREFYFCPLEQGMFYKFDSQYSEQEMILLAERMRECDYRLDDALEPEGDLQPDSRRPEDHHDAQVPPEYDQEAHQVASSAPEVSARIPTDQNANDRQQH